MSLANRLKKARKKAKLTQTQLADEAKRLGAKKVSQQLIQQIESGDVKSTGQISYIARALGVKVEWLAEGEEPEHLEVPARPARSTTSSRSAPKPVPAPSSLPDDLATLLPAATPRSRTALERIAQAAADGKLTEDDLELLNRIAERFQHTRE